MKIICCMLFICSTLDASINRTTYFKGKDHPLDVYTIEGNEQGPTVLIVGGIHGDETSTITAAEEYTTAKLTKGTLIVIPRANVPAIAKNARFIEHDMNRVFLEQSDERAYEYEVGAKIKEYVEKADLVLNLHEGYGFFGRTKSGMGQSVVADSDKVFDLKERALAAIKIMNKNIKNKKYYFKFNNHQTSSLTTRHPEQRSSLTYYSVYTAGKPAYGIEISSDIKDDEYRVKLAMEAVNAFLHNVGIEHVFE